MMAGHKARMRGNRLFVGEGDCSRLELGIEAVWLTIMRLEKTTEIL